MLGTVVKHTQGNMAKVKPGKLEMKEKIQHKFFQSDFLFFALLALIVQKNFLILLEPCIVV